MNINTKGSSVDQYMQAYRLYMRGRQKMMLFDIAGYREAAAYFRQAIAVNDNFGLAYAGLAETCSYWGYRNELNGQDSREYYALSYESARKALEMAPESVESHRAMAVALRRGSKSDPERRKKEVEYALELNPNDAETCYEYWRAHGYKADDPMIYKALSLNPFLCGAHNDLGVVLSESGHFQDAQYHLQIALEINPGHALARCNLGMAFFKQEQFEKAEAQFRKALEISPDEVKGHLGLSMIFAKRNLFEETLTTLRQAQETIPDNPIILRSLKVLGEEQGVEACA
ncbi:tetratricopeptide repeat protein [Elusimicrobiota bacterium]